MEYNTLNICLGHKAFPASKSNFVDFHLTPKEIPNLESAIVIADDHYGPDGSCLSEYAQLFWLLKNPQLLNEKAFIRIIQYRRFVSRAEAGHSISNALWLKGIRENDLSSFEADFSRFSNEELLNSPTQFSMSIFNQYASAHHAEDFVNFASFLCSASIISEDELPLFFNDAVMIPSCNTGLFTCDNFVADLTLLERASQFMYSSAFKRRADYQRRNMGFLLERLNSFLILKAVRSGKRPPSFGFNKLITEDSICANTVNI